MCFGFLCRVFMRCGKKFTLTNILIFTMISKVLRKVNQKHRVRNIAETDQDFFY